MGGWQATAFLRHGTARLAGRPNLDTDSCCIPAQGLAIALVVG